MIWWPEEIPTLAMTLSKRESLTGRPSTSSPSTRKVILRPVRPTDAESIYKGAQDPEVPKFTTLPANYTLDMAIKFSKNRVIERHANRTEIIFAIDLLNAEGESSFAGVISLHSIDFNNHRAEIGYWLVKEARNQGVGTAAVELLTEYGLMTMGFRRVDALVDNRNEASKRLLIKAGYEFEGLLKKYVTRPDGSQIDMAVFAATAS